MRMQGRPRIGRLPAPRARLRCRSQRAPRRAGPRCRSPPSRRREPGSIFTRLQEPGAAERPVEKCREDAVDIEVERFVGMAPPIENMGLLDAAPVAFADADRARKGPFAPLQPGKCQPRPYGMQRGRFAADADTAAAPELEADAGAVARLDAKPLGAQLVLACEPVERALRVHATAEHAVARARIVERIEHGDR